jgi:hypothetical protein
MSLGGTGTLHTVSLEGIDLISTVQFARRSGWAAAVGLPVASLEEPVYRSLRDLGAIGLAAGALAIALALFVVRALNKAFGSLTAAAASVGRGEVSSPSPTIVGASDGVGAAAGRELYENLNRPFRLPDFLRHSGIDQPTGTTCQTPDTNQGSSLQDGPPAGITLCHI